MRFVAKGYGNRAEEFMVVTEYVDGANVYRAVSITGRYLSEAVGNTPEEVIEEVCGIEEVWNPITINEYKPQEKEPLNDFYATDDMQPIGKLTEELMQEYREGGEEDGYFWAEVFKLVGREEDLDNHLQIDHQGNIYLMK